MSHEILKNVLSMDQDSLSMVMKHYGYVSAAVYRLYGKSLVYIIGFQADGDRVWPPSATFSSDYTPRRGIGLPLGWIKPPFQPGTRKIWPKGSSFYYSAQDWSATKLIFVVKNGTGKRTKIGDLDGPLEVIAASICSSVDQREMRHLLSESYTKELMNQINSDLRVGMIKQLETPVKSFIHQSQQLRESKRFQDDGELQTFLLEVERVYTTLQGLIGEFSGDFLAKSEKEREKDTINLSELCYDVVSLVKEHAEQWTVPVGSNYSLNISIRNPSDRALNTVGSNPLLKKALYEVIKNAAMYAAHGKVSITLYSSEKIYCCGC